MERRRLGGPAPGQRGHARRRGLLGGHAGGGGGVRAPGAGPRRNHLDIAPQYGAAESVVGPHLAARREEIFIAGKTLRANPDGVVDQFDNTRRLLHAEVLDLYQAHAVTTLAELDRRSAALERIVAPREAGHTRFAGITGHDLEVPRVHLEALRRFDLDTVMFPVYPALWARPEYREPAEELLAPCAERDIGVMVIKAVARAGRGRTIVPWPTPWPATRPRRSAGRRRGTSRTTGRGDRTAACTSPSRHRASTRSARRATSPCCPACSRPRTATPA